MVQIEHIHYIIKQLYILTSLQMKPPHCRAFAMFKKSYIIVSFKAYALNLSLHAHLRGKSYFCYIYYTLHCICMNMCHGWDIPQAQWHVRRHYICMAIYISISLSKLTNLCVLLDLKNTGNTYTSIIYQHLIDISKINFFGPTHMVYKPVNHSNNVNIASCGNNGQPSSWAILL